MVTSRDSVDMTAPRGGCGRGHVVSGMSSVGSLSTSRLPIESDVRLESGLSGRSGRKQPKVDDWLHRFASIDGNSAEDCARALALRC